MWFPYQNHNFEDHVVKWSSFDGRQASASDDCPMEQMLFSTEDDIQVI